MKINKIHNNTDYFNEFTEKAQPLKKIENEKSKKNFIFVTVTTNPLYDNICNYISTKFIP